MFRIGVLFFAVVAVIVGQSASLGVKGGVQLSSSFTGADASKDQRYIVGPSIEVGLPFELAFEADALFRRIGYDQQFTLVQKTTSGGITSTSTMQLRANSLEFPLLAKYYLGSKLWPAKLYVTCGYVLRYVPRSDNQYLMKHNPVNGLVVGTGAKFRAGRFSVSPEIRYTHWEGTTFVQGAQNIMIQSNHNQADVLVGFTF